MQSLADSHIIRQHQALVALSEHDIQQYLAELAGWQYDTPFIFRQYRFENYYQTMAFVNAVAWIAHQADHHPDLEVSYRFCTVRYTTHAIDGLSLNDFICAARIEKLLSGA